jgi:3-methyladenine DNA glycosylase AlkD
MTPTARPPVRTGPGTAAIRTRLRSLADPAIAEHSARFFKTGPGDYGAGDRFLGIRVPTVRKLVREFRTAPLRAVLPLLRSAHHEERLLALLMMVDRFERGTEDARGSIYEQYLAHTPRYVNNWDLVDTSAPQIVGAYLEFRDRGRLHELARGASLWERRIAIIATFRYIRRRDYADALAIAKRLLADGEDLIHKAAGWMLREIGNRDRAVLESFLRTHHAAMPRTMLRYAIEKLPQMRRRQYLAGGRIDLD